MRISIIINIAVRSLVILFLSIVLASVHSCDKSVILINAGVNESIDTDDDVSSKDKVKLSFLADIYSSFTRATTRTDMSPIDTERLVTIYAYTVGADSYLETSVDYQSEDTGELSPVTNSMMLYPNTYSLYAVGVNDVNTAVPIFNTGVATNIQNGLDYIWCGKWNVDVTEGNDTITIDFQHCCTQIQVNLVVESGITVNSVTSVSLTPPDLTDISWDMFNQGAIGPSDSINVNTDDMIGMGFKKTAFGFRAAYIMVPIKVNETTDMNCTFVLEIDSEGSNRTFNLNLPVYENDMKAGYSYLYNLTLDKDTVLFSGVDVTDWNVIDVNGSPIIPDQVD